MEKKINNLRYIYLLKKNEVLKTKNISLVYENSKDYNELLNYQILLEGYLYYRNKNNYLVLIENYLNSFADENQTKEFVSKFVALFQKNNKELSLVEEEIINQGINYLITFNINANSISFSDLIFETFETCENLSFDIDKKNGINASEFSQIIQANYLKMKNL